MLSFLKVGIIGFGGGAALIPVIETEIVENKRWMEKKEFDKVIAISSISPASLPTSMCSIWNSKYALLSAYCYAFPGPFLYLILMTGFTYIGAAGQRYLSYVSVGLISFVLLLLYRFVRKNYRVGVNIGERWLFVAIICASFALTSGRQINNFALMFFEYQLPTPLFAIDIVHLILLTFFVICFMGSSFSKLKFFVSLPFVVLYALSVGRAAGSLAAERAHLISIQAFPPGAAAPSDIWVSSLSAFDRFKLFLADHWLWIGILMLIMIICSTAYDMISEKNVRVKKPFRFDFKPARNILLFILIAVALTSIVFAVTGDANAWSFALNVVGSALQSFGGGEVYINIAYATFVETEFIPREIYNTQIVGIANSMPGPVLMAIATGIGYTYGSINHSVPVGWLFALLANSMAITATAFGALIVFIFFDILKDSSRLHMVIKYIMPVVCGMLITTAFSLLRTAALVIINWGSRLEAAVPMSSGTNPFLSCGIVLTIFLIMLFFHKKFKVNDIILLLSGGAGTLAVFALI